MDAMDKYTKVQAEILAKGRSEDVSFGNVDDLDPGRFTVQQMCQVSQDRAE